MITAWWLLERDGVMAIFPTEASADPVARPYSDEMPEHSFVASGRLGWAVAAGPFASFESADNALTGWLNAN